MSKIRSAGNSASLDEPFDCSKLVDMNARDLEDLIKEYEMGMERIRGEIVKVYEKAQPYLLQIRDLKKKYKSLGMKFEATRAFAMVERGGSLVSSIDIHSIRETTGFTELDSPDPDTPERKVSKSVGRPSTAATEALKKKGPYAGVKSKVVLNWMEKPTEAKKGSRK